jgi:hypothetical protein
MEMNASVASLRSVDAETLSGFQRASDASPGSGEGQGQGQGQGDTSLDVVVHFSTEVALF